MISYREVAGTSPEFDAAYQVIASEMDPEFLEPEDDVRTRFQIQEHGQTEEESRFQPTEGYRVHMIAAVDDDECLVVGAVCGSFIPRIGAEARGFGLVSYLAVTLDRRGKGVGRRLLEEFLRVVQEDASSHTNRAAFALVFEIERQDKTDIERLVKKLGGYPLDIDFYQPSVRKGYDEQRMNLWLLPLEHEVRTPQEARRVRYPAEFIHRMVTSLFVYEYRGPTKERFRNDRKPYLALVRSLEGRAEVGFRLDATF